jgi:hypothetical protein
MQRYNVFNLIHKALRALLYDTALTIQQTSFANTNEAEIALEKVEQVLHMFEQHAHHEDAEILPAVFQYEPELVEQFEKEHVDDIILGNRLKNLVNIYRNCNFYEERITAGSAISKTFVDFMVFNLEHMGKEENLLNNALWRNYTDAQIIEINQRIVANLPVSEKAFSSKWMIRGINNNDAVGWLSAVKATSPIAVYHSLLALIQSELPEQRSNQLMQLLTADTITI